MELPDRSHGRADGISSKVDMIRRDRNRSGSLGPEDTGENGLRLDSLLANINHGPMLDFTERMQDAIHFSANQGDLQTAVSLVLVLGDRGRGMVGEEVLEAWLLDYIGKFCCLRFHKAIESGRAALDAFKRCRPQACDRAGQGCWSEPPLFSPLFKVIRLVSLNG